MGNMITTGNNRTHTLVLFTDHEHPTIIRLRKNPLNLVDFYIIHIQNVGRHGHHRILV